jgi:hypothetical protein
LFVFRPTLLSATSDQLPPITTIDTNNTIHIREGAFPPSASSVGSSRAVDIKRKEKMDDLADVGATIDDVGLMNASDVPAPNMVEPPHPSEETALEFKKDNSWVCVTAEEIRVRTAHSDEEVGISIESPRGPMSLFRRASLNSRSPPKISKEVGDDGSPSSASRGLRTGLGANLKRFSSLPRTPSRKSEKRLSTSSHSSYNSSVSTVSTVPPPLPELPPRLLDHPSSLPEVPALSRAPPHVKKIISPWPDAMFYSDVLAKKTALERSLGYAAKINELYIHDCGLGEFLLERRAVGQ